MRRQEPHIIPHELLRLQPLRHIPRRIPHPRHARSPDLLVQPQAAWDLLLLDIRGDERGDGDAVFDRHGCAGESKRQDGMTGIAEKSGVIAAPAGVVLHV